MSDQELIELIKEDQDYLGIIYKNCKNYCIGFMRKISTGINDDDLNDIFQEAMIVLYERIIDGNFILTAKIQTYLNSVCRNTLLNKLRSRNLIINDLDSDFMDNLNMQFNDSINDVLHPIANEKEKLFIAIEKGLADIKSAGGRCYKLLTLFWYQRKSINDLTRYFGYTTDNNTRHQKSRCQARLKELAKNYLNS